ncbi:hypothetical protein [Terasakiella pusilla]|uniref:hypothetical protein n=1 Tax=Terasakiella pusilla TaxID=64973 RepID=UPI003AA8C676
MPDNKQLRSQVLSCLSQLRQGLILTDDEYRLLCSPVTTSIQQFAAIAAIGEIARTSYENTFLNEMQSQHSLLALCQERQCKDFSGISEKFHDCIFSVLRETGVNLTLDENQLSLFISGLLSQDIPVEIGSFWLMKVCVEGLSLKSESLLTKILVQSGKNYDYRQEKALKGIPFVRRYPTGALSEKAALILPSFLSAAREDFPVYSPFLVAKTLSYTGGTWDKLKAIPGFSFPLPGEDTIEVLKKSGISMTVAQSNICPADRYLYDLRSVTSTVENPSLIVSSIASKHLAVPVDHLLMDVRYGTGAFLSNQPEAISVFERIKLATEMGNINTRSIYTSTAQPGGISVGNALEVCEAISIMGGAKDFKQDPEANQEQLLLVLKFFETLMKEAHPSVKQDWKAYGLKLLEDKKVLKAFYNILVTHGLDDNFASQVIVSPEEILLKGAKKTEVRSKVSGKLRAIDQKALGFFVNFQLSSSENTFGAERDFHSGILLRVKLNQKISKGDVLLEIYSHNIKPSLDIEEIILSFFEYYDT